MLVSAHNHLFRESMTESVLTSASSQSSPTTTPSSRSSSHSSPRREADDVELHRIEHTDSTIPDVFRELVTHPKHIVALEISSRSQAKWYLRKQTTLDVLTRLNIIHPIGKHIYQITDERQLSWLASAANNDPETDQVLRRRWLNSSKLALSRHEHDGTELANAHDYRRHHNQTVIRSHIDHLPQPLSTTRSFSSDHTPPRNGFDVEMMPLDITPDSPLNLGFLTPIQSTICPINGFDCSGCAACTTIDL